MGVRDWRWTVVFRDGSRKFVRGTSLNHAIDVAFATFNHREIVDVQISGHADNVVRETFGTLQTS
jgi:hypothetical protein